MIRFAPVINFSARHVITGEDLGRPLAKLLLSRRRDVNKIRVGELIGRKSNTRSRISMKNLMDCTKFAASGFFLARPSSRSSQGAAGAGAVHFSRAHDAATHSALHNVNAFVNGRRRSLGKGSNV